MCSTFAGRLVVAAALVFATPVARANTAAQSADGPSDLIARPLTQGEGAWLLRGNLELTLDVRGFAQPFSLAPDVWYGVTQRLTIGVVNSFSAVDLIDAGGSLCFRGAEGLCRHTYRGSGMDVLWSWLTGDFAVAPRARFLVRDVDPWKPAVTLGALARWTRGRFAISADPYLRLGVANRDLGNRATVVVPVWLALQPAARWLLALHTGWDSELATWRDGWHVPMAIDVAHRFTPELDAGFELGFPHVLGPQNNVKIRSATVFVEYRAD